MKISVMRLKSLVIFVGFLRNSFMNGWFLKISVKHLIGHLPQGDGHTRRIFQRYSAMRDTALRASNNGDAGLIHYSIPIIQCRIFTMGMIMVFEIRIRILFVASFFDVPTYTEVTTILNVTNKCYHASADYNASARTHHLSSGANTRS